MDYTYKDAIPKLEVGDTIRPKGERKVWEIITSFQEPFFGEMTTIYVAREKTEGICEHCFIWLDPSTNQWRKRR